MSSVTDSKSASVYEKLQTPRANIRLLSVSSGGKYGVRCKLETFGMPKYAAPYIAVSYTWGDPTKLKRIMLNGHDIEIRENLYDFLAHFLQSTESKDATDQLSSITSCEDADFRNNEHHNYLRYCEPGQIMKDPSSWRHLWIDALCIDQSSLDERSAQVSIMDEIYNNAEFTIAWLGCEADNSKSAMQFMAQNYNLYKRLYPSVRWHDEGPVLVNWDSDGRPQNPPVNHAFDASVPRQAIVDLFARPFWKRLWIVQEFVLSTDILFMCGNDFVSVTSLMEYMQFCNPRKPEDMVKVDDDDWGYQVTKPDEPPLLALVDYRYHTDRSWSVFHGINVLFEMLQGFASWECSEPKDRIFSMLGMTKSNVRVDYRRPGLKLFKDVLRDGVWEYLNDFDWEHPRWTQICQIMISAFGLDEQEALDIGAQILEEENDRRERYPGSFPSFYQSEDDDDFEVDEYDADDDIDELTREDRLLLDVLCEREGLTAEDEPDIYKRYELMLEMQRARSDCD